MSRDEIALRLLCAFIASGKFIGAEEIRNAFALAISFEEHAAKVAHAKQKIQRLSFDDNGL